MGITAGNAKSYHMNDIWAIILAAGESRRMESAKMLLPFGSKTMIEMVIGNISASEVSGTLVVLGSFRDEILEVVRNYPVVHCFNENYRDGMLTSVKCGLVNLPENYKAVLICPGDQPLIRPDVINRVIEAYRQTGKGIVIPVYRNKRGHPLLVDRKYGGQINLLDKKEGLRMLAHKFPGDVMEVDTNSPEILKDFDTKDDYLGEINKMR